MSREGFSENVGLFLIPPTDKGIENKSWVNIRPTSQITDGGTIDFNVMGNTLQYMDLEQTRLKLLERMV
jgi:hypothetical protein